MPQASVDTVGQGRDPNSWHTRAKKTSDHVAKNPRCVWRSLGRCRKRLGKLWEGFREDLGEISGVLLGRTSDQFRKHLGDPGAPDVE